MVSNAEEGILQVDDVSLHMNRDDLTTAVTSLFLSVGVSGNQKAGVLRPISIPDEILSGGKPSAAERKGQNGLAIGLGQIFAQAKSSHHECEYVVRIFGHRKHSTTGGSATIVSQPPTCLRRW